MCCTEHTELKLDRVNPFIGHFFSGLCGSPDQAKQNRVSPVFCYTEIGVCMHTSISECVAKTTLLVNHRNG